MSHDDTVFGFHPRSRATSAARRRLRSSVPISSFTSTTSVLSSPTRSALRSGCHARKSITPRSPQIENETSGTSVQSGPPARERASDHLVQTRVTRANQAIEVAAAPSRLQIEPDVERRGNTPKRVERDLAEVAPLDPRDRPSGNLGDHGKVLLPQPVPDTRRAEQRSEPVILHRPMMPKGAYPGVTRGLPGGSCGSGRPGTGLGRRARSRAGRAPRGRDIARYRPVPAHPARSARKPARPRPKPARPARKPARPRSTGEVHPKTGHTHAQRALGQRSDRCRGRPRHS